MTPEQKAAFINSQVACCQAKLMAMQADNTYMTHCGHPPCWNAIDFEAVPDQFGLGHNTVVAFFQE